MALLGAGVMARELAPHLRRSFRLRCFNRTASRIPVAPADAVCASAREAAVGADVVLSLVGDDEEAAAAVWDGAHGALAGLGPGALALECSTVSAARIDAWAGPPALGWAETIPVLVSAMLRTASLDQYEQGDVWAKAAELRPEPADLAPERAAALTGAMRRLMTLDTRQLTRSGEPPRRPHRVGRRLRAGRTGPRPRRPPGLRTAWRPRAPPALPRQPRRAAGRPPSILHRKGVGLRLPLRQGRRTLDHRQHPNP
ncbi:NAD(P)-binding domain-containing protein [Kitasatospora sp. NPDC001540]|uniref:NAD(P)-binding domain-containing protein n=1 Tax=Kitasatospora sp. NPDC001540 TaxID=3364014 RepID=UPI0036A6CD03